MATTVRLLQNYTLSGVPYKAGDLVSIDSTLATQLSAAKVTDSTIAAINEAIAEGKSLRYPGNESLTYGKSLPASGSSIINVNTLADIPPGASGVYQLATGKVISATLTGAGINDTINYLKTKMSVQTPMELAAIGTPPTLLNGADFAGSTISGSVFYPISDNRIYKSKKLTVQYNTQGRDVYASNTGGVEMVTFITDAPEFELDVQAQTIFSTPMLIDGVRASDTPFSVTVASGNIRKLMKFTFAYRKVRRISFEVTVNIAGIYIGGNYSLKPVTAPNITMLNLADSYGGGGYYGWAKSSDQDLAAAIGLEGAANSQIGGTGYAAVGSGPYQTFIQRLQEHVADGYSPSILAPFGGINDLGDTASISAVNSFYAWVKANLPNSLIIATGPWAPQANQVVAQPKYTTMNNAIKAALAANGLSYIFLDTLTGSIVTSWGTVFDGSQYNLVNTGAESDVHNNPNAVFTGSGHTINDGSAGVSPTIGVGAGNSNLYISTDLTHPTLGSNSSNNGLDSGRAYLSKWVYNSVKQAVMAY